MQGGRCYLEQPPQAKSKRMLEQQRRRQVQSLPSAVPARKGLGTSTVGEASITVWEMLSAAHILVYMSASTIAGRALRTRGGLTNGYLWEAGFLQVEFLSLVYLDPEEPTLLRTYIRKS